MAKKSTYVVEGKKSPNFEKAVARAVDLSLARGEAVVIVEYNEESAYALTIRAQSEAFTGD